MFDKNVSGPDRFARAGAGTALLAGAATLCLTRHKALGALSGLTGLILLGTAAAGWCPIYKTLGISTVND